MCCRPVVNSVLLSSYSPYFLYLIHRGIFLLMSWADLCTHLGAYPTTADCFWLPAFCSKRGNSRMICIPESPPWGLNSAETHSYSRFSSPEMFFLLDFEAPSQLETYNRNPCIRIYFYNSRLTLLSGQLQVNSLKVPGTFSIMEESEGNP